MCLFILALFWAGCSLKEVRKQAQISEYAGFIKGKVDVKSEQKGPVIVLRFRDVGGVPALESAAIATAEGDFQFAVLPGPQYIAAFIDENNDGKYQPREHGIYYGNPSTILVGARQIVTVDTLVISGKMPVPDTEIKPIDNRSAVWNNIGRVTDLSDPRFTRDNYNMGLWKPFDFLDVAEGGLFFLQEYQKGKVPVLFVHGVKGGPTDWQNVIATLDKERFQPWVFFYPSGFRLEVVSDYLVQAVSRLQSKYGFEHFNVIAHSMGGLVTRSFVKKYVTHTQGNARRLRLVMTINSPMAGMASAAAGVKHSPIVIPSWRDVEPRSDFLQGIQTWNWPKEIPYHLVVSYKDGKSGDGTIPLQSQAPLKLQLESTRMYVFNNDHVGTLNDKDFHVMFNKVMADSLI